MKIYLILLLVGLILVSGCTGQKTDQQQEKTLVNSSISPQTAEANFSCENDNSKVQSRGYILLMGLADHHKDVWDVEKNLMEQDSKAKFVLIYDQDENLHLEEISKRFLADTKNLLGKNPVEELVIFGASAGGVTASYSISKLNFSGPVALHTLSSPLKGYDFKGIGEAFLGERTVFEKEIALGLQPFNTPGKNVKAYHHKTVTDTILKDYYCGSFASLCDPIKIQNNNIEGSKEFYYPKYDHNPLMGVVIRDVLKCYNPQISKVIEQETIEAEQGIGLGSLCSGEESCEALCHSNKGMCTDYCNNNPKNPLCQKSFAYDCGLNPEKPACKIIKSEKTKNQNVTAIKDDKPPVLKNLGVNIGPLDTQTNLAGDLVFTKKLLFDDGRVSNDKVFLDFGSKDKYRPNDIGSIEYWFFVPLGTKLHAPIDGIVHVNFINHSKDWGINIAPSSNSNWFVSFEHMINLAVKEGDIVKAGDIVGEASPRNTFNYEVAMTELAIWTGGNSVTKYCPFSFLDESLKPEYEKKINQLTKDWEKFIGKDVYQEEKWVLPGCLEEKIIETGATQNTVANTPQPKYPENFYNNDIQCASNPDVKFTNVVVNPDDLDLIVPMGAVTHDEITTHTYLFVGNRTAPIYAPVNSVLTEIFYDGRDYGMTFQASCEFVYTFGHITDPVDSIKKLIETEKSVTRGTEKWVQPLIKFKAGDLLGRTAGTQEARGFDLGAYHKSQANYYVNKARYEKSWKFYNAVCPYDYFDSQTKAAYYSKFGGFGGIVPGATCGTAGQDKAGTISGNWHDTPSIEWNPSHKKVAFGTDGDFPDSAIRILMTSRSAFFIFKDNPTYKRPKDVTGEHCYSDDKTDAVVYVKIISNTEMKMYVDETAKTCPSSFPEDKATTYYR